MKIILFYLFLISSTSILNASTGILEVTFNTKNNKGIEKFDLSIAKDKNDSFKVKIKIPKSDKIIKTTLDLIVVENEMQIMTIPVLLEIDTESNAWVAEFKINSRLMKNAYLNLFNIRNLPVENINKIKLSTFIKSTDFKE